jgi:SOS-response transcriptional repressor LexA
MESKTKKKIALSPAKLAANRANALKSTGPRTPEGQRRSAANVRVKHGFRTHEPKLSEADLAEIAELEIDFTAQWQSATPESSALVHEIAAAKWRMDQILMTIDEALNNPGLHPTPNAALDRYLATAQATRRRARKALQANSHARTQTGQPQSSDLRQRTQTAHSKSSDLHTRTQTEELKSSISHARTQTQITWTSSTSPPFTFWLLASNSSNLTPPPPSGKLICL